MLAAKYRFHGHGSLRYLYKNADAYRSRLLVLKALPNPRRPRSRYAVIVSKKVHKSAVGRNRIRRRIYEVLRHESERITKSTDIAVIVSSSEVLSVPHDELAGSLQDLLAQAGAYR